MKANSELMEAIAGAIERYAEGYSGLEKLQRDPEQRLLPIGDQKTGVIAEFYARIYANHVFSKHTLSFGSTSEPGWDIKLTSSAGETLIIQVKATSAHSETSRVSPIHPGWNQLWLVRLDEYFKPQGFWIVKAENVPWSAHSLLNRTMPDRKKPRSGSKEFAEAFDDTERLVSILETELGIQSSE